MKKSSCNQHVQVMVVGSCADEFIRYTVGLLGNYGVEFDLCGDVYQTVGRLVKNGHENVLVIGRFEQLVREEGRFFQKVSERGFSCCCLADKHTAGKQKQILCARREGVFVINEPIEVEEVVIKLLTGISTCASGENGGNKASAFNKDEFVATKAELEALLGV